MQISVMHFIFHIPICNDNFVIKYVLHAGTYRILNEFVKEHNFIRREHKLQKKNEVQVITHTKNHCDVDFIIYRTF